MIEFEDTKEMERRQTACLDKLTWPSRELALAARAYAGWQYGTERSQSRPYQCRYCGKWHLARS